MKLIHGIKMNLMIIINIMNILEANKKMKIINNK
jgi:hypothetical protein